MPIDPFFSTMLANLDAAGKLVPASHGTAQQARDRFKANSMARRGSGYVPEVVAGISDHVVDSTSGPIHVRVYVPVEDRGRVVTYAHGGGWAFGDIDTHDPVARRIANGLGAQVVSVDYRRAPESPFPAGLVDVAAALVWTAAAYPDQARIVAGDSAGAQLAIGTAMRARLGGPRVDAALLLYPFVDPTMSYPSIDENGEGYFLTADDLRWFYDQLLPDTSMSKASEVDLLHADLTGLPPTVVATAEFDPLRDEGVALVERLRSFGVTVEHVPGLTLIHGFASFAKALPAAGSSLQDAFDAVDGILADTVGR
ncbi:acetyl esterase [Rhodococcus sp. 27YEA15]|uniref:alpha/beta hydrolase n=1 Tax=Rhodococcus sp. 27YEA15 TaxID=3156259 RepID=UPI003C7996ED